MFLVLCCGACGAIGGFHIGISGLRSSFWRQWLTVRPATSGDVGSHTPIGTQPNVVLAV
jgi:hypothetical protein